MAAKFLFRIKGAVCLEPQGLEVLQPSHSPLKYRKFLRSASAWVTALIEEKEMVRMKA